jgi:hypothetical protein
MGDIPAKTNMISSIITFPLSGSKNIESDTTFNITVQTSNLVAGSFTNADATYYAAPQFLENGNVVGHTHVTVQDMGKSLNPTSALDPTQFAFFKGINDAGNGQGLLQAVVTGGLPAGNYRVCTMTSASNHQPVLMPVAQRGTSDDCTKFTVIGNGKVENAAANDGSKGIAAAAAAQSAVDNPGPTDSVAASTAAATSAAETSAAETSTASKGRGRGGKNTKSSNGGGKAIATPPSSTDVTASSVAAAATTAALVEKTTVIETFFIFSSSLGGLPPSVSKNGEQFAVLEELFDDLASAATAACNSQYETCISFQSSGFSFEECSIQKTSCSSAAVVASATAAAPGTITAVVTVPTSAAASVTGSILAESTVLTTVSAATTSAPEATAAPAASGVESACSSQVTNTITVDPPASTALAAAAGFAASSAASSDSVSVSATSSSATPSSTASVVSAAALGGFAAPAVTDSGDSSRPFEVNGNTFVNESAAKQRSCDIQNNACSNAVNGGTKVAFTLADCTAQQTACNAS